MTPEELEQLDRLMAAYAAAQETQRRTRTALFGFMQQLMLTGRRGTRAELIKRTRYSPAYMDGIKSGKVFEESPAEDVENSQVK